MLPTHEKIETIINSFLSAAWRRADQLAAFKEIVYVRKIATALLLLAGSALPASAGTHFGSWEMDATVGMSDFSGRPPPPGPHYFVTTSGKVDGHVGFQVLCEGGEYKAKLIILEHSENEIADSDMMVISIDGKPRGFNASTWNFPDSTDLKLGHIITKITNADLDWIANAQSLIRVTLPSSRREFEFKVNQTRTAIATLRAACEVK
jgi:hypothetical protein